MNHNQHYVQNRTRHKQWTAFFLHWSTLKVDFSAMISAQFWQVHENVTGTERTSTNTLSRTKDFTLTPVWGRRLWDKKPSLEETGNESVRMKLRVNLPKNCERNDCSSITAEPRETMMKMSLDLKGKLFTPLGKQTEVSEVTPAMHKSNYRSCHSQVLHQRHVNCSRKLASL